MGRRPKTSRQDELDELLANEEREEARGAQGDDREDFENPMFSDVPESPFHIPRHDWPQGLAMRWISIEVTGAPDNRNWSLKTAARWTPVARGKYAKIDERFPTTPMPGAGNQSEGFIIFGGLCLCERDIRLTIRDKKNQEKATLEAGRTIESYVEGGNASTPRFNQSGPTQYERGRAQFKE